MLVTDAVATALTKLGASRHAETPRSGDIPEHWPTPSLLLPSREHKPIYADSESDSFRVAAAAEHLLLCAEPGREHLEAVFVVVGKPTLHLCRNDGFRVEAPHQSLSEFE